MSEPGFVFAVINNIPCDYHSSDLRNYFSQFIESRGFECFHFRHRPEIQKSTKSTDGISSGSDASDGTQKKTLCCVIKLTENKLAEFLKMYHRKHWLDRKGNIIPSFCYIAKIQTTDYDKSENDESLSNQSFSTTNDISGQSNQDVQTMYKTRAEQKKIPGDREKFTQSDLEKLPELCPPEVMPNGNVGTPTMVFMEFIKQCRLPPVVIKKLGLTFPRLRSTKRYGTVNYDYGGEKEAGKGGEEEEIEVMSASGHVIPRVEEDGNRGKDNEPHSCDQRPQMNDDNICDEENRRRKVPKMDKEARRRMRLNIEENMIGQKDEESGEDNDSCEEWERHEALYDDPSNQERNKERLFEEEIELKWEKGGSGLVFYTDAQYWQAQEGDFDEQTADDWDVDMSVYYEEGAGDKDARDYITMRQEQRRRNGQEATDRFTCGIAKKRKKERQPTTSEVIGKFEQYSKGVGSKIMKKQGWTEGEGLGSTIKGISDALDNDGKNPKDRSGFGYRGEKLVKYNTKKPRVADKEVIISTKYDNPAELDPPELLLRRHEPYHITYRHKVDFLPAKEGKD